MKKYQKLLFSAFALLGLLTGCDKIDPFDSSSETPGQKTIVEIVTGDRNFSRLAQAVTRANLAGDLGGQNLTLFAPNNAAFAAAGIDSVAIARMAPATLANILKYHVLSSAVRTSDLSVGINQPRPTLNGTAYISKFNFGLPVVAINGVRVTLSDIAATNGVIHILDNVLLPPTGTIVDVVRGNPSFTFLLAAVTRANLGGALSAAGPLTVFAPTDNAFITTTPFKTIAQINAASPADLAAILTYHVTPGRVFTTNFVPEAYPVTGGIVLPGNAANPGKIPTLAAKTINVNNELRLTGLGNGTDAARIVGPNLLTTNGVIQVIDRVLLPGI